MSFFFFFFFCCVIRKWESWETLCSLHTSPAQSVPTVAKPNQGKPGAEIWGLGQHSTYSGAQNQGQEAGERERELLSIRHQGRRQGCWYPATKWQEDTGTLYPAARWKGVWVCRCLGSRRQGGFVRLACDVEITSLIVPMSQSLTLPVKQIRKSRWQRKTSDRSNNNVCRGVPSATLKGKMRVKFGDEKWGKSKWY